MTDATIQDVSDTAFMVAVYRATESERPDALFRDPLAGRLAGDHGRNIVANMRRFRRFGEWMVAIRTHIIDDYIAAAIREGVDTIVNLGAGLDTRPYRMDLPPALNWIEVDFPRIIELKDARLRDEAPRCRLSRIKLDLSDVTARRRLFAGIAAGPRKALVLTEGVIPYLDEAAVGALADDLRQVPIFVYWIADYISMPARRSRERIARKMKMQNAPFKFSPADYFGFFKAHGWQAKTIRYIPEEAQRLKRRPAMPFLFLLSVRVLSLVAGKKRRESFRTSMAYVLFEPA